MRRRHLGGREEISKVLILTFSSNAAKEILTRLEREHSDVRSLVVVKTFHGLCYQIVRNFSHRLGYTITPSIAPFKSSTEILIQALKHKHVGFEGMTADEKKSAVRSVKKIFEYAKSRCDPGKYLSETGRSSLMPVYCDFQRRLVQPKHYQSPYTKLAKR